VDDNKKVYYIYICRFAVGTILTRVIVVTKLILPSSLSEDKEQSY